MEEKVTGGGDVSVAGVPPPLASRVSGRNELKIRHEEDRKPRERGAAADTQIEDATLSEARWGGERKINSGERHLRSHVRTTKETKNPRFAALHRARS